MTKDLPIDPRVTEFLQHLETGLAQAGLDFRDYNPTYVHLRNEDTNELTTGCIFSQVINPIDAVNTVCVNYDGVSFPVDLHSKIPFKFEGKCFKEFSNVSVISLPPPPHEKLS